MTLALVVGGYALAESLHVSAPIAAVVAGLVIGNTGRKHGMSDVTRDHLDKFWSLVDDLLNSILFVLVGFELIHISLPAVHLAAGICAIVVVLLARLISVVLPIRVLAHWRPVERGEIPILTWGGLRGGISLSLSRRNGGSIAHRLHYVPRCRFLGARSRSNPRPLCATVCARHLGRAFKR